ncbi:MAG: ribonuclease P protein component [Sandaracinaceae bacterium]|nr:ribonuclease P protein component [Sandaracinaceae bacterium]
MPLDLPKPCQAAPRKSEAFRKKDRIRKKKEFERVQSEGVRIHTPRFVIWVMKRGDDASSRLGVSVSRKVGSAVRRNRVKRVVREVFRRERARFPCGCDIVFVARPNACPITFQDLLSELIEHWFEKKG